MVRTILGALAGVVVWVVLVSAINLAMRSAWPAYALVEKTYAWTLPMQLGRLANSAVATIAAGYLAAAIAPAAHAALGTGLVLLLLSLPVHYMEFDKMPLWYHAVYLVSLVPLAGIGGRRAAKKASQA